MRTGLGLGFLVVFGWGCVRAELGLVSFSAWGMGLGNVRSVEGLAYWGWGSDKVGFGWCCGGAAVERWLICGCDSVGV